MKPIVIYNSRYGTAKRYAEKLAELAGMEVVASVNVTDTDSYDRVVYVGAIYAGRVLGLKSFAENLSDGQELVVVTVGLTDPTDVENVQNIRNVIKSHVPEKFYDESKIFHLRGSIDYERLGILHRVLMSLIRHSASKLPVEKQDATAKAVLESYGRRVDYVDFDTLQPILKLLKI
jgi:menaquinone-dependent protoporphyrinogen IX oxidase